MKDPFEIYTNSKPVERNRSLDWEESAVDSGSFIEEVLESDKDLGRIKWLWVILFVVFAVFFGRLFYLQIIQGQNFRGLSKNNRIRSQIILAPRGLVLDIFGKTIAQNKASFNLIATPFDLPKQGLEGVISEISQTFGLNKREILQMLELKPKNSIEPIIIKRGISKEENILFETKASKFVGFSIQKIPVRDYLEPEIFSHILGYTGLLSKEDLKKVDRKKYNIVDFIGKSGIEQVYEDFLHGINGESLIEVDASGNIAKVLGENKPTPGSSLILNIDKQLQEQLYKALVERPTTKKAAAVAMNPKTGQIMALVSIPGFDNNLFAQGIKPEEYKNLLEDKNLPLFNRVVSGTYPPGSTVKPMVAIAALEEGVVKDTTVINDKGVLVIANQYDPSINYNFYGWKRSGLGPVNIRTAIAKSSDIYFYTVGGGHPNSSIKGLGPDRLAEYYRKFNLGKKTLIDLPNEKSGLVADPNWKYNYFKDDKILRKWYLGDTYHIAIGQGDMLTTPLQVAMWTSIIANNGVGMQPKILNRVQGPDGKILFKNKPEVLVKNFYKKKNLKIVQEGMRETVLAGSGAKLLSLPISSAGKTGTSQFDGSDPSRTHAWFTAYAPFENPEIVITVLIEAGGEGYRAAVPVVKETLDWWAENRYNK